jgi:hypothetical protein
MKTAIQLALVTLFACSATWIFDISAENSFARAFLAYPTFPGSVAGLFFSGHGGNHAIRYSHHAGHQRSGLVCCLDYATQLPSGIQQIVVVTSRLRSLNQFRGKRPLPKSKRVIAWLR